MISNAYANKILNHLCGKTDLPQPGSLYIGLCDAEPDASAGTVTGEPAATSYGRVLVGGNDQKSYFGTANAGKIANTAEIQFKTARTAWGVMKYFFLSQSATGPAIMWGELKDLDGNHGVLIDQETVPTFYEGDLVMSLDVPLSESTDEPTEE